MPTLFVVGGGLFGAQAAAYARSKGIEAVVFDAGLAGAASPAAAGLFKESWAGRKLAEHFRVAVPVLERLYGIRTVHLRTWAAGAVGPCSAWIPPRTEDAKNDSRSLEPYLFVPPAAILERAPVRAAVSAVGDGWVEANGRRYNGWVYVAAGVWCGRLVPGLGVYGKAGSSFLFTGECEGQVRQLGHGRQAVAFVRDPGTTFFSDGTAEREHTAEHDRATLARAAEMGLTDEPIRRLWGMRPYVPGGPVFRRIGSRTWLATGGRKMGTILGAAFARRLVEEELGS